MNYLLAFAPDLGVSPAAFVAAWNAQPQASVLGTARVVAQTGIHYDPALGDALVALTLALTSGIAGNALYDLIKALLADQGIRRSVTLIEQQRPDGTQLLIIHVEEEG